jgi:hypothetical protein
MEYPEGSQATTVLVLAILGLVACPVLAPIAWWMSRDEIGAIDAGRRPPHNRSNANAGRILAIIGTAFFGLLIVVVLGFVVLGLGFAMTARG